MTICGIKVLIIPATVNELGQFKDSEDEQLWGFYDETTQAIYVSSDLNPVAYKRVLMHEITHAILTITGANCVLKEDKEELVCTAMENMVSLFLDKQFLEEMLDANISI